MSKTIIDDGFRPDLVETACFDGRMEVPIIEPPNEIIIPEGIVPFTHRNADKEHRFFICFYEHDIRFFDCITSVEKYLDDFRKVPGVISPDCSLYLDMPLCLQIANIYMNRAIGHYLQDNGIYVIPNVRWGDERTFTTIELPEKVAFLGLPKHSIVSVGTYGCIRTNEDKYYFREGLIAMLDELEPEVVLVYGAMPAKIFEGLKDRTRFVNYQDWISFKRGGNR